MFLIFKFITFRPRDFRSLKSIKARWCLLGYQSSNKKHTNYYRMPRGGRATPTSCCLL